MVKTGLKNSKYDLNGIIFHGAMATTTCASKNETWLISLKCHSSNLKM